MQIEVLMPDGQWVTATKEANVQPEPGDTISPQWVRFHFPDGRVALAAPGRWRVKTA